MKRIFGIAFGVVLILGVLSCAGPLSALPLWDSMTVYGADASENTTLVQGNIMAVFYKTSDQQAMFWATDAVIVDTGDGKWDVTSPDITVGGVSQALMDYGLYKYMPLPDLGNGTYYLDDLGLESITWSDLPRSLHVAGLVDVYLADGHPRANIKRLYMGQAYDIPGCRVSQTAYDSYMAGDIQVYDPSYSWESPENADCFVLVYFITETPYDTTVNIPVIVDKIIK